MSFSSLQLFGVLLGFTVQSSTVASLCGQGLLAAPTNLEIICVAFKPLSGLSCLYCGIYVLESLQGEMAQSSCKLSSSLNKSAENSVSSQKKIDTDF